MGAKQVIATHTARYGDIHADLLERILTSPRLTVSQLRDMLEAYHFNPGRLSALADPSGSDSSSALAHYAVLNGQLIGQGESHVVH